MKQHSSKCQMQSPNVGCTCGYYGYDPNADKHYAWCGKLLGKSFECTCGKETQRYENHEVKTDDDYENFVNKAQWCVVEDDYCVYTEVVRSRCKACKKRACEYCSVYTRKVPVIGRGRICHVCLKKYGLDDVVEEHMEILAEFFGYSFNGFKEDDYEWDNTIEDLHLSPKEIL